ncbi:nitroreductase family protein [Streptomyces coelicoflavus]|uniref:nitroreductase family protein n=1 Tax=Streptomyces coelicoflavus TaxID=285562 RepID=UPI002E254B28
MPLVAEDEMDRLMPDLVGAGSRTLRLGGHSRSHAPRDVPDTGLKPLDEVLWERRSVREFAPEPVSAGLVDEVFTRAQATQDRQWPTERHGGAGLRIVVAAHAVDGLSRDLHLWDPRGGFTPMNAPGVTQELREAYTNAPAFALVCGSPPRAPAQAYAGLLTRAGALGHALGLSACTHGLGCSPWGGTSHRVTREASASGAATRHLFTLAMGRPARVPGGSSPTC